MLFSFLKYVSPVWYFNLSPKTDFDYFPDTKCLEANGVALELDANFISQEGRERDLAYRAFQLGFLNRNKQGKAPGKIWETPKLPVADEYRFLRKNFNVAWMYYVLIIRLISFKNPTTEIRGIFKSRGAKRERYHIAPIKHWDYLSFQSQLIKDQPLITVVIPTLNRYAYLKDVFRDLEKQTYQNFEVIVVDQTDPFNETAYQGWNLNLRYWYQPEKALWKARNEAIRAAKGDYILLYDDDSLVEPDWIEQHIKTLDYFTADLSSGVSISTVGAKVPAHYSYFRWSDQLDTGNVLLKKQIFSEIGLFDTTFEKQRMGDGEFGLRAYLAGYRNVSNPYAKRIHLKVGEGGLRQMGSWDGWRPKKFFGPRPVPSILYLYRKYFGNTATRWMLLKSLPSSVVPYKFKSSKVLLVAGSLLSLFLMPLVLWQVVKSWHEAGRMLASNPTNGTV